MSEDLKKLRLLYIYVHYLNLPVNTTPNLQNKKEKLTLKEYNL